MSLLTESFISSFDYDIPKDPEKLLYDFYFFAGYLLDPKFAEREEEKFAIEEALGKCVNNLQVHMIKALKYACAAEFRHILGLDLPEVWKDFSPETQQFLVKFEKNWNAFYNSELAQYEKGYKSPRKYIAGDKTLGREKDAGHHSGGRGDFLKAYAAVVKTQKELKYSDFELANVYHEGFTIPSWHSSYGGAAWDNIARALKSLLTADTLSKKVIYIDHAYDLQHNTDTVFNKLKKYYKEGKEYDWIREALNWKRDATDIREFYFKVSEGLRPLVAWTAKKLTGKTIEDLIDEKKSLIKDEEPEEMWSEEEREEGEGRETSIASAQSEKNLLSMYLANFTQGDGRPLRGIALSRENNTDDAIIRAFKELYPEVHWKSGDALESYKIPRKAGFVILSSQGDIAWASKGTDLPDSIRFTTYLDIKQFVYDETHKQKKSPRASSVVSSKLLKIFEIISYQNGKEVLHISLDKKEFDSLKDLYKAILQIAPKAVWANGAYLEDFIPKSSDPDYIRISRTGVVTQSNQAADQNSVFLSKKGLETLLKVMADNSPKEKESSSALLKTKEQLKQFLQNLGKYLGYKNKTDSLYIMRSSASTDEEIVKALTKLYKNPTWGFGPGVGPGNLVSIETLNSLKKSRMIDKKVGYFCLNKDGVVTRVADDFTSSDSVFVNIQQLVDYINDYNVSTGSFDGSDKKSSTEQESKKITSNSTSLKKLNSFMNAIQEGLGYQVSTLAIPTLASSQSLPQTYSAIRKIYPEAKWKEGQELEDFPVPENAFYILLTRSGKVAYKTTEVENKDTLALNISQFQALIDAYSPAHATFKRDIKNILAEN